jgi:hypothetical protein
VTALAVLDDPTVTDDAVPFGPPTFLQETTRSGYEAVARLHDEAMAAIAAIADAWDAPVAEPAGAPVAEPADDVRVLRMTDRPAVALTSWGMAAA